MARFLIVGHGPSASALADALEGEGHVVSTVTRVQRGALEHVAIVCWLERSSPERFLLRSVDSSMRGFVYQAGEWAAGDEWEEAGGGEEASEWEHSARDTAARNSIPVAALRCDPEDAGVWLAEAREAINSLLEGHAPG